MESKKASLERMKSSSEGRYACLCPSRYQNGQIVALVQSAEPRHRYDSAISAGISPRLTTSGCFLRQPEVRSVIVVVVDVLNQEALEMPFVQGNHVVEQIPTATPNSTGDE
jgi:hypothetical protein